MGYGREAYIYEAGLVVPPEAVRTQVNPDRRGRPFARIATGLSLLVALAGCADQDTMQPAPQPEVAATAPSEEEPEPEAADQAPSTPPDTEETATEEEAKPEPAYRDVGEILEAAGCSSYIFVDSQGVTIALQGSAGVIEREQIEGAGNVEELAQGVEEQEGVTVSEVYGAESITQLATCSDRDGLGGVTITAFSEPVVPQKQSLQEWACTLSGEDVPYVTSEDIFISPPQGTRVLTGGNSSETLFTTEQMKKQVEEVSDTLGDGVEISLIDCSSGADDTTGTGSGEYSGLELEDGSKWVDQDGRVWQRKGDNYVIIGRIGDGAGVE